MTKIISELNPGDYFLMDGEICQIVYPADCTYASPTTVEVHRQRQAVPEHVAVNKLFETLTVPNTIEVTPGTVKFTLDFRPTDEKEKADLPQRVRQEVKQCLDIKMADQADAMKVRASAIKRHWTSGRIIPAIKYVREKSGCSLKAAKMRVDALVARWEE